MRRPVRLITRMRTAVVRLFLPALVVALAAVPRLVAAQADAEAPGVVGEPTEDDIRSAYAATLETVNRGTLERLGEADGAALLLALEDLTKLGCRGMSRAGVHYDCRVQRRVKRGDDKPVTDVVQLWLSHDGAEWVAR